MRITANKSFAFVITIVIALFNPQKLQAAETGNILNTQCAQCHDMTGPATKDINALINRKGPALYYAGNKYKQTWLVNWLQKPVQIRPAGMYYGNHIKPGSNGDSIDPATLVKHPQLNEKDARTIAAKLMTLKANSNLIIPGEYKPGTIPISMGDMLFDKFRGCLACHQVEPGYGGLSGPEVYTAAQRLQDDYLISYMRNPQAWDPRIFMPNKHLSDTDLQKFVHYFHALSKENKP